MESLKIELAINTLRQKQINLLNFKDFSQIFSTVSKPSLYATLKRLRKTKTIN